MEGPGQPASLAGSELGDARHVCAFFNSREEEYRVTLPFVLDGLTRGEKAVHIIDPARRADHVGRVESFGIDLAAAQSRGQFDMLDWSQTFFRAGPFDIEEQLAALEGALKSGREMGYPVSRYVAHAEWALEKGASLDLLLEFEARVNHIWPRNADTVICTYDLSRFSGRVIIDAIRTHPMIIIGGFLQKNPFFTEPEEFVHELHQR